MSEMRNDDHATGPGASQSALHPDTVRDSIMPAANAALSEGAVLDSLRPLARRAVGMSGADIERLVREARQKARREKRSVTWADLEALLSASRPSLSHELRWRMAIHEAGHAVARLAVGLDGIEIMTIDASGGGFVRVLEEVHGIHREDELMDRLTIILAGRRAEIETFGSAVAGAGGLPESDLGTATQLAVALETSLGYGRQLPLLCLQTSDPWSLLSIDRALAARVHERMEEADAAAAAIIRRNASVIDALARDLMRHGTLESEQLDQALAAVRRTLQWHPG